MTEKSEPVQGRRLAEARREGLAALAIVSEPNCLPGQSVSHLVAGWEALRAENDDETELVAFASEELSSLKPEARKTATRVLKSPDDGEVLERLSEAEARAAIEALLARIRKHELEETGKAAADKGRLALWARRFGGWAGIVVVFIVVGLRPWTYEGVGQWHGAYYPGKDFRGEPDTRREADVDFNWGVLPPTDSIPSDRFAARFTTCLNLDEDVEAAFQLLADDAATLFIDGESVIDLWEPPEDAEMPQAFGRKIELEAGRHTLEVEYREESESAEVHLLATFDLDLPPGPVPSSMLDYPGDEFDEEDPCGTD